MQLDPHFLDPYRTKSPPMDDLGLVTFLRTYSAHGKETWFDVCKRVVEGAWTIGERGFDVRGMSPDHMQKWGQRMFDHMFNMRWVPAGRGLQHMGHERMWRKGSGVLQNCFAAETQVYVRKPDGKVCAQTLSELAAVGEVVQTLLPDGTWAEAEPRSFGVQNLNQVMFRPVNARSKAGVTYFATADHEWVLEDGTRTRALKSGDVVTVGREYVSKDALSSSDFNAGFVHGFVFGDGSVYSSMSDAKYRYILRLCGSKVQHLHTITTQFSDARVTYPPSAAGEPVIHFESPEQLKRIPNMLENTAYLRGFIEGWHAADGTKIPTTNRIAITTQNLEAVEWLAMHSHLAGFTLVGRSSEKNMITNYGVRKAPIHTITLQDGPRNFVVAEIKHAVRRETVYCLTVPVKHAFVLVGGIPTGNCAYVDSANDAWISFLANMSMLGVGVGFDTSGARKHTLRTPTIKGTCVVSDTREGWVDVFTTLYAAITGARADAPAYFDLSALRPKGAPLVTMGGVSSGPGPLGEAIVKFCKASDVLSAFYDAEEQLVSVYAGQAACTDLTPLRILDFGNIVGVCVVSGGIRRSAEIAIFDQNDESVFHAKRDTEKLYAWRWASNNTVRLTEPPSRDFIRKVVQNCNDFGDPGLLFLYNVLGKGRTGDVNARERGHGCNPCGEQPLESMELCNLVEICLPRCTDYAMFEQVALCALYYGKLVTMLPVGYEDADRIMHRNRRIGVSVTGFVECADRAAPWLTDAYSTMRKFDQRISRLHNVPESVKITSVKPSGTVSIVLGCSPGMNPHYAPYYIRRINIEDTSPLVDMLSAAGYPYERNKYSKTSYVFEFPMRATGPTALNAIDQLKNVLTLQANWSDNMVSNTIVFDEHEIDDIADFVHANSAKFKSLAFLKREHGFEQAPLEEITQEEYEARIAALRPLDLSRLQGADVHDTDERGCESGKCEISFGADGDAGA